MPSTQNDTIRRLVIVSLLAGLALVVLAGGLAFAGVLQPVGTFTDDDGNVHEGNIEAIAAAGITKGCNPPANDLYCPGSAVTRGQMAAFLVRALALPPSGTDHFIDDDDSIFENDINSLAESAITKGCNPPASDKFCPDSTVTREQMAAFLVRALDLTDDGGGDLFIDDDSSIFESDIDKLGTEGITKGCNPPTNDRYCPTTKVQRDQMASFLGRALGLDPIDPLPPTTTAVGPPVCTNEAIHWCYGTGDVAEFSATLERTGPSSKPWETVTTHPLITHVVDPMSNELLVRPEKNATIAKITFIGGGARSEIVPLLWSEYLGRFPIPEWADRIEIEGHDAVPADFGMTIRVYELADGSQRVRVDNYEKPIREMKVQHRWAFPGEGFNIGEWFPLRDDTQTRWFNVDGLKAWDLRAFYPIPESSGAWAGRTQLAEVVE